MENRSPVARFYKGPHSVGSQLETDKDACHEALALREFPTSI